MGNSAGTLSKEDLTCPLCLELYRSPRLITPCLHTFCMRCIHLHITDSAKAVKKGKRFSSFSCPVCQVQSSVPNPLLPPSEWASQLSLNTALIPGLTSVVKQQRKSWQCNVCSRPVSSICHTCDEYLCLECVEKHNLTATPRHVTVRLEGENWDNLPPFSHTYGCPKHAMSHDLYFCKEHKKICCSVCRESDHKSCQNVVTVHQRGLELQMERKNLTVENKNLQKELSGIIVDTERNICVMENKPSLIQQEVKKLRFEMNRLFDKLEQSTLIDSTQKKYAKIGELSEKIHKYRTILAAMRSSVTMLNLALEHGTGTEVFNATKMLNEQMASYHYRVANELKSAEGINMEFAVGKELSQLLEKKNLGNVVVEYVKVKDETNKCIVS